MRPHRNNRPLAVLIATAVLALFAAGAVRAEEIRIGVLGSFSGPYASWGQHFQQAVDLWLEQHKSRVGEHTLSVLYRDVGGANPQRAKQLAQELVVRDKVHYLAGLEFTPTVLAVAEVIDQAKMPFVIFNSGTSVVTRKSPFYIRTGFTQWSVAVPEAHWVAEQGKKRAVIISADFAPGYDAIDSYTKGFTEKGGTILDTIKVPMGTTDFSSYLQRIRDAKPDSTFMFMPVGPMSVGLIKAYMDAGLRQAGIELYAAAETDDTDLPAVGDSAVGMLSALHYSASLDTPANKAFVAALTQKYGAAGLPNIASVAAYDGMAVVAKMIEATGSGGGEKAVEAAKGFAWESPRGPVSIDPKTRDIVQNIYIRRVEKVGDRLINKTIQTYPAVKDPWKEANPE
jgi:branched-chain amino acid transport system substrate-binding protein